MRNHILFNVLLTASASLLVFLPRWPFDRRFGIVAVVSAVLHLILYVFYPRLKSWVPLWMSYLNVFLLGVAVFYTGGILSPFVFVFSCIIILGSVSELRHRWILPATILTYVAVLLAQFSGRIPYRTVSPELVYGSWFATLLVMVTTVGFLIVSALYYDIIYRNVQKRVADEQREKEQLVQRMGHLEATSQIGAMVTKIAHDIHGPLSSISSFVEIHRQNENLDAEARKDFEIIVGEADRISKLIQRMLHFVKPGEEEKSEIRPAGLLETIVTVIQFHPKSKGVRFETAFPGDGDLRVFGNKDSLQQVYFNIAKNAVEALEGQKVRRVTVALRREKGECVIEFCDNGPGISEERIQKILGGFHSTKEDGTGLGLVIAQEIIRSHGGRLSMESERGKGTVVRTVLPLMEEGKAPSAG
ncbi:MAG TPA: ATP-binding protein [Elusimicrobiota bacterium]|nr:ATP-binding protein [Elusimicrobiota bacterium]